MGPLLLHFAVLNDTSLTMTWKPPKDMTGVDYYLANLTAKSGSYYKCRSKPPETKCNIYLDDQEAGFDLCVKSCSNDPSRPCRIPACLLNKSKTIFYEIEAFIQYIYLFISYSLTSNRISKRNAALEVKSCNRILRAFWSITPRFNYWGLLCHLYLFMLLNYK